MGTDIDTFLQQKADTIKKGQVDHLLENDESYCLPGRKESLIEELKTPNLVRDRSISHTFGVIQEANYDIIRAQNLQQPA